MIIKINRKRRLATQREPGSIFTDCEQSLFCLKINERPQYDVDVQAPVPAHLLYDLYHLK